MTRWRIRPNAVDLRVAKEIKHRTSPAIEKPALALTYAADEKVLMTLGAALWLASRMADRSMRRRVDQLALALAVTTALPHLMKRLVSQERPDRRVHGRRRGIPISGRAHDAFPSGHAMHMGAIASALAREAPRHRAMIWSVAGLLSATRVLLLAHWVSDVVAGFGTGVAIERGLHTLVSRSSRRG